MLLQRAGHDVITADNGRRGLRTFFEVRPDLVVLDVLMPELDGWQTLERLRDLSDVPVLMFSGTKPQPEQLERLRPGRDAFRSKPFFGNELVGVVDERSLLARLEAAGDAQDRAGRVGRVGAQQPGDGAGDLVRLARAAERDLSAPAWPGAAGRRGSRSR